MVPWAGPPLWPWVLAAAAVAFGVLGSVLNALAGSHGEPAWQWALAGRCGARLVRSRAAGGGAATRSSDRLAAASANAFLLATFGVAEAYAAYALQEQPGALPGPEWAVLWDQSAWPLLFAVLIAIAFVFPDGRLPSPRWRRVAFAAAASVAAFLVLSFFDSEPFESPYEDVDRPLPGLPGVFGVLWPLAFLGMLASLVAGVQAVRVRFRRAPGIERLQLKWLAYTAVLVPATLLVCVAGALATGSGDDGAVFTALFFFMLGAIPTSVGVAVLRYRLYDIDRVINRTLVYGVLTAAARGGVRGHRPAARHRRSAAARPGRRPWQRCSWRSPSGRCARGCRTRSTAASAALATTRERGS